MEIKAGDAVLTNSGRFGKVIQVWGTVACVEIRDGKSKLSISYPANQLTSLRSTRTQFHHSVLSDA
jgi:preprotein translocase subunit YajC